MEWLNSLPLTKLFESAKSVCNELGRLNRSRIDADERLKLLEIYEPVLQQLLVEIAEDYNKAPLPLPATSRQAVNLARELLIEEAYAYKLALLEKTSKLLLFGGRKQLVPLIEQVMRILSNSLALSYQAYLPTPAGVWHEMHELYRYASQQKLLEEEANAGNNWSIDSIYKYAVLIALTDPYRLPRSELPDVMRVAAELAALTELHSNPLPEDSQPLFVILPDTDKPPRLAVQAGMDGERRSGDWVISTGALVQRLSEVVRERGAAISPPATKNITYAVPLEILRRLIQCWGSPHKRSHSRQLGQATVHVCASVERICKLLDRDIQANVIQSNQSGLVNEAELLSEWNVINQSAVGIKLRGMPTANMAINVGEVIAVRHHGILALSIGVVRWAQTFEDGSVEFGAQMLAPWAEPVTLVPTIGNHYPRRALLLPEIPTLHQPAAVIASPGSYQSQREFVLTQSSQISTIRAAGLAEKTGWYELFNFHPA